MAISIVGTPAGLAFGSGSATPAAQAVSIPSGADVGLWAWTYFDSGTGQGLASALLGAASASSVAAQSKNTPAAASVGFSQWNAPTSGTPNLAPTFDASPDEGSPSGFLCLAGVDTTGNYRDTDGALSGSMTATTVSGDWVIKIDSAFSATPTLDSGWTNILVQTDSFYTARISYKQATGSSESVPVASGAEAMQYVVLKMASGGGGGATQPARSMHQFRMRRAA